MFMSLLPQFLDIKNTLSARLVKYLRIFQIGMPFQTLIVFTMYLDCFVTSKRIILNKYIFIFKRSRNSHDKFARQIFQIVILSIVGGFWIFIHVISNKAI